MSGRIGDDILETIRDRSDIVALVSSYLQLKRSGANHFGLCPFHSEKSPSFSVSESRQSFHCFGCGEGGDVFAFLMKMEGLSFPEAARKLAEQAGVEIPEEQPDPEADQRRREKERLWRINAAARDYYQQVLLRRPEGEAGRNYLKKRGYDGETARAFELGYAPQGWEGLARHLAEKGFDPEEVRRLGLVRPSRDGRGDYDLFRERLIFPIFDLSGEVAAFGGRLLGAGEPKYLNSPESPVYHKGRQLYGLYRGRDAMRRQGEVLVVEGYFDVIALQRAGFENVVATCGTAMTEDHARLLKRYARKVLFLFDQDAAGLQATWKGMAQILPLGLSGAVVRLPQGDDPDSFLQREGKDAFQSCLAEAQPVLEVYQEHLLAAASGDFGERARSIEEILRTLLLIPGEIERDLYLQALASRCGIDLGLLKEQLAELAAKEAKLKERRGSATRQELQPVTQTPDPEAREVPHPATRQDGPRPVAPPPPKVDERQRKTQRLLLKVLSLHEEYHPRASEAGLENLFVDRDYNRLAACLLRVGCEAFAASLEAEEFADSERQLGREVLAIDQHAVGEGHAKLFEDCLRDGETRRLRQRLKELQSLIDKAEREGDDATRDNYLREKTDLNKRLK